MLNIKGSGAPLTWLLKLWYQKMRKPLLRRSCFGRAELWVSWGSSSLAHNSTSCPTSPSSLTPHQDCYFTKETVTIRQLPDFLLPDCRFTFTHTHRPGVSGTGVVPAGRSGRRPLLLWAPHCTSWPLSFLAPSFLCIDGPKLPTLGVLARDGLSAWNSSPHLTPFPWLGSEAFWTSSLN